MILAGCSGAGSGGPVTPTSGHPASSPAHPVATHSAATATGSAVAAAVAPLSGLPASGATAQRPAVAVAVGGADPVGLGSADIVFAEMSSPVRYLAVFQSAEAPRVGPVTSIRPEDGQALSVMHPVTGYDGGTSSFIAVLDATKVVDAGYAAHAALYTSGSGGLDVSTSALASVDRGDGPPPEVLSYRTPGTDLASVGESRPTSVRVEVPGQPTQQWTFDARTERWVQTAGGPRVSVANLVVQVVPFKTVYLSRKYGETAQSARVVGDGTVTVFSGTSPGGSGGTAATGTWHKPGLAGETNYFDSARLPMGFEPGPTWIILAPAGTRTSQVGG